MFDTDAEIISFALDVWGNYIETYNVSLSAQDVKSKTYQLKHHQESNYLTTKQQKLVNRIHELSENFRNDKVVITPK